MKIAKDDFALEDLNKAIELDANFYQAYYNRGTLFKRMGKSSEAEVDLTKAKALAQQELEEKTKQ
jgi:Flp pilus assembly protein TadD